MIPSLTPNQTISAKRAAPDFPYSNGFSGFLNDVLLTLRMGLFGVLSFFYDIDSICSGGGSFSVDLVNTNGTPTVGITPAVGNGTTGLNFAWLPGQFYNGMGMTAVAGGSLTMGASANPNYVELDRNGTIYSNVGAWTAGRTPLYEVVTSSSTITAISQVKSLVTALGPGSITGTMLSTAANTRNKEVQIGAVAATTVVLTTAPVTGTLIGASIVDSTAITASDTNYWTVAIVNLGASNAGTQAMLANTAANTTKATGGSSMGANTPFAQALASTSLAVTKGDVLQITLTKTAAATSLTEAALDMDFSFTA